MASHYETLDIAPTASYDKIRSAYHDCARRWHPDRFVEAEPQEAEAAELAMRQANEAWRVLGDEVRRRDYDRGLRGGGSGVGHHQQQTSGVRVDDGVTRIDPRLLNPEFLDNRRQRQLDETASVHSRILRLVPLVGFVGLLIGIFVFSAYARGDSEQLPTRDTAPNPPISIPANACVRIIEGPELISVPCTGLNDGRLIGQIVGDGSCEALEGGIFTVREVPLPNGVIVCLGNA